MEGRLAVSVEHLHTHTHSQMYICSSGARDVLTIFGEAEKGLTGVGGGVGLGFAGWAASYLELCHVCQKVQLGLLLNREGAASHDNNTHQQNVALRQGRREKRMQGDGLAGYPKYSSKGQTQHTHGSCSQLLSGLQVPTSCCNQVS